MLRSWTLLHYTCNCASPRTRTLTLRVGTEDAKPLHQWRFLFLGERRVTIPLPLASQTSTLPIELHSPYKPHFTRLTDWLPYGSGGLLLFQDSVERVGIEPTPLDFQSSAITWSATVPIYYKTKKSELFEFGP